MLLGGRARRPLRRGDREYPGVGGYHQVVLRAHDLVAELEDVERPRRAQVLDLFAGAEEQRARRADGGAHGLQVHGGPVVAEVALHHEVVLGVELGHAEGAGEHAVAAPDATLRHRREDDAVGVDLDGVGRADASARRVLAVHAHGGRGLYRGRALEEVEVDHGVAAVAGALAARLLAGPAADAAVRVDEELAGQSISFAHAHAMSFAHAHAGSLSIRTAATWNSGMPAIGP